jgi:hypothetical protein
MMTRKKTVPVAELLRGVPCQTGAKMVIDAQFIGHLLVEVCGPDGHAAVRDVPYKVEGPGGSFTGTVDGEGRLRHEDIVAGDYLLTFTDHGELSRVVTTAARRDVWQRTTVMTPREKLPPPTPSSDD